MKIGIIGPNKIYDADIDERKRLLISVAKTIVKSHNEIVLTPDKDSLLEYFGSQYLKSGGTKIRLVIPTKEPDHKDYLNTKIGEVVDCTD